MTSFIVPAHNEQASLGRTLEVMGKEKVMRRIETALGKIS
jgi:hypothetical protein